MHPCTFKEKTRCAKISETWRTLGITGGTLVNTTKHFTFRGLSNIKATVKTDIRTAVKTKEYIVTEKTTARVLFIFHLPEEALQCFNPIERMEQPQKLLESPAKYCWSQPPRKLTSSRQHYDILVSRNEEGRRNPLR